MTSYSWRTGPFAVGSGDMRFAAQDLATADVLAHLDWGSAQRSPMPSVGAFLVHAEATRMHAVEPIRELVAHWAAERWQNTEIQCDWRPSETGEEYLALEVSTPIEDTDTRLDAQDELREEVYRRFPGVDVWVRLRRPRPKHP